jgi:hypothetical protein
MAGFRTVLDPSTFDIPTNFFVFPCVNLFAFALQSNGFLYEYNGLWPDQGKYRIADKGGWS